MKLAARSITHEHSLNAIPPNIVELEKKGLLNVKQKVILVKYNIGACDRSIFFNESNIKLLSGVVFVGNV